MPVYILLSTLTDDGARTLREKPGRVAEVNREVEAMGAKVVAQYATLGHYDFVSIVEAPNEKVIAKVSIALSARGSVRIETLTGIPVEQFSQAVAG